MQGIWILLITINLQYSNQSITGIIFDSKSNKPVEFATIYINGTMKGTLSDIDGFFTLEKATIPCQIVISHVSYNTLTLKIDQIWKSDLILSITPKVVELEQVTIVDRNEREKNLQRFKTEFLGTDEWGKGAILVNENVLKFNVEYFDENLNENALAGVIKSFHVEATAPLHINLPLLGYDLQYDLITFRISYYPVSDRKIINTLGYYYYKPMQAGSKFNERRINRNRARAYYFSPQHFTRSLFKKQLMQNGYLVYEKGFTEDMSTQNAKKFYEDSCNCLEYRSGEAMLTGMKNKTLNIKYYSDHRGYPINLTKTIRGLSSTTPSEVYFLNDTCVLRRDGTRPGESILFGSRIGNKRIGAALPDDYEPDNKK